MIIRKWISAIIIVLALSSAQVAAQSSLEQLQTDRAAALKAGEDYLSFIKNPASRGPNKIPEKNWNLGVGVIEEKIKQFTGQTVDLRTLPVLTPTQEAQPVPGDEDITNDVIRTTYRKFYIHLHDTVLPQMDRAIAILK